MNIEAIELYGDESTPQAIRIAVASAVLSDPEYWRCGHALMTVTVVVPHDKMGPYWATSRAARR